MMMILLAAFTLASTSIVQAKVMSLPPLDREAASPQFLGQDIAYNGGPVISHVKVYAVFWGSKVSAETVSKIPAFYQAMVNSTYMDQLAEYGTRRNDVNGKAGTQQDIGRGTFGGTFTIVPVNASTKLNQAAIEQELEKQISMGTLPKPDADSMYMIHYPQGISISISFGAACSSWEADHEFYHSAQYGNIYYAMMPNCGGSFSKLTMASSHELAEAVTDPASPLEHAPIVFPAAWIRADGQEIGDVCAWQGATLALGATKYNVQKEWRNTTHDCGASSFIAQ